VQRKNLAAIMAAVLATACSGEPGRPGGVLLGGGITTAVSGASTGEGSESSTGEPGSEETTGDSSSGSTSASIEGSTGSTGAADTSTGDASTAGTSTGSSGLGEETTGEASSGSTGSSSTGAPEPEPVDPEPPAPVCGDGTCDPSERATCYVVGPGWCKPDCYKAPECLTDCPCAGIVDGLCDLSPGTCDAVKPGGLCDPNGDGSYMDGNYTAAWLAWQAKCK